ncbi:MAG: guanylate kinase [Phycisphaerae bacterium]
MPNDGPVKTARRTGRLIVISGPSGTGKTSICNRLLEQLPDAVWSISATTRPKRPNEVAGENYRFISPEEFEAMRARGEFLETAEYVGNMYGTPAAPAREAVQTGKFMILEIEVQGGVQVAQAMPDSIRVFVLPPTHETLVARLEGRKTESAEQLKRRLAEADGEIAAAQDLGCYQHFVTNDILDETVADIMDIIDKEMQEK